MRLYFLRNVRAGFAPNGEYKEGGVYDVPFNNIPTMLENNFAVPEDDKPKNTVTIKKPILKKKTRGRPKVKK